MKRRHFLQYLTVGCGINYLPLCKAGIIQTETVNKQHLIQSESAPQLELDIPLDTQFTYTFDNYIVCKSNRRVFNAAFNATAIPCATRNPLLLIGDSGLGKTHLLHAIENKTHRLNPYAKIKYVHAEQFVAEFMEAKKKNSIDEFRKSYYSLRVILFDDVHFLFDKPRLQGEFYHLVRMLINKRARIVIAGGRLPGRFDVVQNSFNAALQWTGNEQFVAPKLKARVSIVHEAVNRYPGNMVIPNDVSLLIAKTFRSNMREIFTAVSFILSTAQNTHQEVSLNMAKDEIKRLLKLKNTMEGIEHMKHVFG